MMPDPHLLDFFFFLVKIYSSEISASRFISLLYHDVEGIKFFQEEDSHA